MITYLMKCDIIPELVLKNNRLHKIKKIAKTYNIKSFQIVTDHNCLINEVHILNSFHPNACDGIWDGTINGVVDTPPPSCKFCLPEFIINRKMTQENVYVVKRLLSIINFDNCYYFDLTIEYKELY